ncbi:hypothetical protein ACHAWF_018373 [Thalassiosira exigua]
MRKHTPVAYAVAVALSLLALSAYLSMNESIGGKAERSVQPIAPEGHRSLGVIQYLDPKTTAPRVKMLTPVTVNIYLTLEKRDLRFDDNFNEALSIFKTGLLERYGTGRVQYAVTERAECNRDCNSDRPEPLVHQAPCLAVTRWAPKMYCDVYQLKCSYPSCKTMVTNDEFCHTTTLPYDSREYYTSERSDMGYLPIGPRTNADRKNLALIIEKKGSTKKRPIFTAMAEQWHRDANDEQSEQVTTDDYIKVVLDSVFTLSPAGHSPECFRLFEAVEAGTIPVMSRADLHGEHHPEAYRRREYRHAPHPCKDSLQHWYDAPIVVLDSWRDLYPTVERLMEDPVELDRIQSNLRSWYKGYMCKVMADFEDFILDSSAPTRSEWANLPMRDPS